MTDETRERLTLESLPTVTMLAEWWATPRVPMTELVQEGLVEVWRRAERYDETRASFRTWAGIAARSGMLDHIRRTMRYRRQPTGEDARKRIRAAVVALALKTGRQPDDHADYEIADELGVGLAEYHTLVSKAASVANTTSLDAMAYDDSGDKTFEPTDPYPPTATERVDQREIVEQLLQAVTPRQRLIIEMHYFNKLGLLRGVLSGGSQGRGAVRIGKHLGMSEGLVFMELRDARRDMRLYADAVGITADG